MELEDLTQIIGISPYRNHKRGEPRATPNGKPLDGVYKKNSWAAKPHEEKRLFSTDIYLEDYLESLNQRFAPHKEKFAEIVNSGGYIEYFVGWFGEGNIGATLEPKLLKTTADLHISIGLDIYAYDE